MKASVRKAVRARDRVCQMCGSKGVRGNPLTIHHIKCQHSHPELVNEMDNLILLCRKCHDEVHGITHGEVCYTKPDDRPRLKSRYWIRQMEEDNATSA